LLPNFGDERLAEIVDEVYDPQLWARPLAKYIEQRIEPTIIAKLMES
jgi:ATP-dependent Clp protease ATP-binding subunit ClpA